MVRAKWASHPPEDVFCTLGFPMADVSQVSNSTSPPASDYSVFAHLNAEKSGLYRAILNVFVAERARFALALRPFDLQQALSGNPLAPEELDASLRQLRDWGISTIHPTRRKSPRSKNFIVNAGSINSARRAKRPKKPSLYLTNTYTARVNCKPPHFTIFFNYSTRCRRSSRKHHLTMGNFI